MSPAFSRLVTSPDWREDATAWIAEQAAAAGVRVLGVPEQRRLRPWSTHLVVETDAGRWWFKALCPSMAFEPALQRALAVLVPEYVVAPLAIDAARGWMLTRDEGEVLGETRDPTVDDWRLVLRQAGELQRRVAAERDLLLAAGMPDCSPSTVPERFDRLLERFSALPGSHPSRLAADGARVLRSGRGRLVDAADELAAALPATLQHGDLHPWNVFAASNGRPPRLFDLGDAQWACGAEVLAVPRAWIEQRSAVAWAEVDEAYAAAWPERLDLAELRRLGPLAELTHAVNRAQTWLDSLETATAAEVQEWGAVPRTHLLRVADGTSP